MAFVTVDTEVQVVEPWELHKRGALAPPSPPAQFLTWNLEVGLSNYTHLGSSTHAFNNITVSMLLRLHTAGAIHRPSV